MYRPLSRAATERVTVDYATADGTAKASEDYTAKSGTLLFAAGERAKTVAVPILDDGHDERRETFTFRGLSLCGVRRKRASPHLGRGGLRRRHADAGAGEPGDG